MKNKNISILVAYSSNRVIGAQGVIPWKLPSERNRFKEICNGKKVIMGRKSFEEIGKALSYCTIVVISKTLKSVPEGCLLAPTFEKGLEVCNADNSDEILVAGGEKIYTQALPLCKTIYATEILKDFQGDTFFPEIPEDEKKAWTKTIQAQHIENDIQYRYVTFVKA